MALRTAKEHSDHHAVLAIHAGGSIEAEGMQIAQSHDAERSSSYARRLSGLD